LSRKEATDAFRQTVASTVATPALPVMWRDRAHACVSVRETSPGIQVAYFSGIADARVCGGGLSHEDDQIRILRRR